MQFTTYAVQTVQSVELVRAKLVSDSSKQWFLLKYKIFGLNSSELMSTNTIKNMLLGIDGRWHIY